MTTDVPQSVSVVGLGKLGLAFAACLAHRGFQVTGIDISPERVAAINAGTVSDVEPGLQELLRESSDMLTATTNLSEAVGENEVIYLFVNTPGEPSGKFTTKDLLSAIENIGPDLAVCKTQPLVVLVSSVTPGTIEEEIIPALERVSGRKNGEGFYFCYNPVLLLWEQCFVTT
ncbi:MAG: 3-hydroxyacyl-CoA dehydrogenase NAD-binding domain-containing protein [Candidatus Andersenbacteria bacterium]